MKIIRTTYRHVNPKTGACESGGGINVEKGVKASWDEGCGLPDCHCSDGYWLCINLGAKPIEETAINEFTAEVEVITVEFENREEMEECLGIKEVKNGRTA